jgi:dTDP-4-dehydrorhamnose 3,5-epimerase
MDFQETNLSGVKTFHIPCFNDARGTFKKLFHAPDFAANGFPCEMREEFFTVSRRGVIRGMHFQLPPAEHFKIVTCLVGEILDVLLDVRKASLTFGKFIALELSGDNLRGVAIQPGIAHGFLALSDDALVHYLTSHEHSPQNDSGVRWDSFGMLWPEQQPIVSAKDAALPRLEDFVSPF